MAAVSIEAHRPRSSPRTGSLRRVSAEGTTRYPAAMTVSEWLLKGDPAIGWQVIRDLTDEPADRLATERARVAS